MCEAKIKIPESTSLSQITNNAQYYKEREAQFTEVEKKEVISEIDVALKSTGGDAGLVQMTARQATILLACWHNLRCVKQGSDWEHLCKNLKKSGPVGILHMIYKLADDLV